MRMILEEFTQFGGNHCQTAALKSVLAYHELELSEEMLLGLGGGIGFIYWYMKQMPAPFVGGRYGGRNEEFLINICRRIGGDAALFETTSVKKGHTELLNMLQNGEPVYTYVDMAYLPYMVIPEDAHFGAHTIAVYGIDEEEDTVYVADRGKNPVTCTVEDLKEARSSKYPPFPPKNRILKIDYPARLKDLQEGISDAIKECCHAMLHPPIKNFGLEGIKKWANVVKKWPDQFTGLDLYGCLMNVYIYIEIGGTGGSAFRPMFARFLREASCITNNSELDEVAVLYEECGKVWSAIAEAALPDSWVTLKKTRELMFKKNRIFEEQKPDALPKMVKINGEMEELMGNVVEELQENKRGLQVLLTNLQQRILNLHQVENKAVHALNKAVK